MDNIGSLVTGMRQTYAANVSNAGSAINPMYGAMMQNNYVRPQNGDISGDGFLQLAEDLPDDRDLPVVMRYFDIRL